MASFLPLARVTRPAGRSELLLSHPLNQALCFASVADSAQAFDLISRNAAPMVSADSYVPSPMGPSWKYTANSTNSGSSFGVFNPITTSDGAGGGDFAIGAFANPTAAAGIACLIDQRKGAASNEQIGLFANSTKALSASSGLMALVTASTGGVTQGCQSVAGMVDGLPHVWEGRRFGTAHSIWRDGINVTNTSDVSANIVWSVNQSFEIGAAAALTSATFGANCNIVFCWARNMAPDDGQMLSGGQNPWQRFKAIQPRLFGAGPLVSADILFAQACM